jgi:hypothetical protein
VFKIFDKTIGVKNGVIDLYVLFSVLSFSTYSLKMLIGVFPLNIMIGVMSLFLGGFAYFMANEKQIKTYFNVNGIIGQ